MDVPSWSNMDQKQRIMAIGGGVVLLLGLGLIVRGMLGGGGPVAVPPSEAVTAFEQASQDGTFKEPPPPKEPVEVVEPGSSRGLRPE